MGLLSLSPLSAVCLYGQGLQECASLSAVMMAWCWMVVRRLLIRIVGRLIRQSLCCLLETAEAPKSAQEVEENEVKEEEEVEDCWVRAEELS